MQFADLTSLGNKMDNELETKAITRGSCYNMTSMRVYAVRDRECVRSKGKKD